MSWEAWLTLVVLGMVLGALVRNRPPDAVLLGAAVIVTVAGVITPKEAFAGFSNEGMLTVAALFVVVAGLRETGALETISKLALGKARSERGVLLRLCGSVTGMSAFMNNTPIVAMFIPVLQVWSRKHQIAPSRLLLPLSYLTILGGMCTLIGTSTNLIVHGLMTNYTAARPDLDPAKLEALRGLGMFEIGWVGLPVAIMGAAYLLTLGRRLLPDRQEPITRLQSSVREYLVNFQVQPNCPLTNMRIEEAGLRHLPGLFLIEIVRGGQVISPVGPNETLQPDDVLTFTGAVTNIVDLEKIQGLVPVADMGYEAEGSWRAGRTLCEAVVSATSPTINKSIRAADFRALYNAAVVAVHRGGHRLKGRVGDIVLLPGDTLLLQTGPHFSRAHRNNPDFYLVSGIEDARPVRYEKAILSLAILAALVVMLVAGVSTVKAAFLAAGLMIATRCVSTTDARQAVDWQTLVTIAASFGLGAALDKSGLASAGAGFIFEVIGGLGPYAVLIGIFVITTLITESVTNNAAAVLMFPFAIELADTLDVSARPFVIAIAVAASASFMTPHGYQTNLMVAGPGGYRFTDYLRVGIPLNLIVLITSALLIPIVWPFSP